MDRINRDTFVAIALLVLSGVLFWASFEIREPDYGVLPPSAWPRLIVAVLGLLSFIFLIQSVMTEHTEAEMAPGNEKKSHGFAGFFSYWRNPIYCFTLFMLFLLTMPYLGMLVGGISFVFLLLNMLGGWQPRQLALHAVIAVLTMGVMWSIFTFGLRVILPPGTIFNLTM